MFLTSADFNFSCSEYSLIFTHYTIDYEIEIHTSLPRIHSNIQHNSIKSEGKRFRENKCLYDFLPYTHYLKKKKIAHIFLNSI